MIIFSSRQCQKLACILLTLLASTAYAKADKPDLSDWTLIADNGTRFYMSPKHMTQVADKQVEAWEIRTHLQDDVPFEALEKQYEKALYLYDCQNRTVGLKQIITHYSSGQIKDSGVIADTDIIIKTVNPRSIDEAQLNYACSQFGW